MNTLFKSTLVPFVLIGAILLWNSFYTISMTEQVIITQFGKVKGLTITEPGIHLKTPFIDTVNRFDKRVLEWDSRPVSMTTRDKQYLEIGTFARWRITDPLQFFVSMRDERTALSRLDDNLGSSNAITGTFAGLPEGAEFYEDGQWWRISYTGGTGNDVVLTRIAATTWQTWQSANFGANANNPLIAGDLADNDKDLTYNLMEYATGMNPSISDSVPQSAVKNGSVIDFIYTRNKAATDVTYTVEWSDDLVSWSTAGVTSSVFTDGATTQQIKALVPAGTARRFVHLKVTRP